MQTVLFYRQSKQRLKDMNKKGNSIDRKNVECYYKKRGGETNKIMHIAQTRRKILKKKENMMKTEL